MPFVRTAGLLAAALAVWAAPARAQTPAYPPGGPDFSCLCLDQAVGETRDEMQARQGALAAAQSRLNQLDARLAEERAKVDVNNPQSVAAFRQLLAQRDAAFRQSTGDLLATAQGSTARYNQAVAAYNSQCAGRPLPPAPPGPLNCPAR